MTGNLFVDWVMGPQLLGLIFLTAGYLQKTYPPKEINSLYGYRTTRSMQNQQTWDAGNRYSTRLIIKCAWILLIIGFNTSLVLAFISIGINTKAIIKVGLMLSGAFGVVAILTISTEKHLKRLFDNKPL
ncbi:SdpI family protein [Mucilaginibacter glaciei]|uniref:SdpI family protein n=1 Tax=Mucilaginibacter glaciei TaxID=2772109 RepID=A0A926NY96_9SPHI|nr:SdpI family protein [Mucilaginibacter glaciei]MBD1393874.1 SdpI family protein [Mucilaginibacter glaciei]